MDDQVLVEPDVGRRPFESNRVAIEAMTLLLGPNASNAKKDLEEGACMGEVQVDLGFAV